MAAQSPIFCVVQRDGEHWQIEAEWPDGSIEQVLEFKAYLDAMYWVKTQSDDWVAGRIGVLDPHGK